MPKHATLELLKGFLDAFNRHDVDDVMTYFADDCVFYMPRGAGPRGDRYVGKKEVRAGLARRFEGIPDVHYGEDQHWACGNFGVSEWTLTGTSLSGKRLEVRGWTCSSSSKERSRARTLSGKSSSDRAMNQLFLFSNAVRRDPAVTGWMHAHSGELGIIAQRWFDVLRACGDDVRELLHDGHPTACVGEAAFAYVNAFTAHVNVGFFRGAELADPAGLLEGTGKYMRHVKLSPGRDIDERALGDLIDRAYSDMKHRLEAELR